MRRWFLAAAVLLLGGFEHGVVPPVSGVSITTHHYDAFRTGWNQNETTLNVANVGGVHFGVTCSRTDLDDQIDAQPLVIFNLSIGGGTHNVVYVVTENNTVYALDASSCSTLASTNLGAPVAAPFSCTNNGANIGINSTPVADVSAGKLFVVTYTLESSTPTYRLHSLNLTTLADTSVILSASATLSDSSTYNFNATVTRIRSALLLNNGQIYIATSSFCDSQASLARGWVLEYNENTLALTHAALTVSAKPGVVSPAYFLTSIWMSGAGLAADASGNVYFTTGNGGTTDLSTTNYATPCCYQETVAKLSSSLSFTDFFTPHNFAQWDLDDTDLGSGGVLLLPDQTTGGVTHLAITEGKSGNIYLLNRDSMGGYTPGGPDNVLQTVNDSGGCFCTHAYFVGSDDYPRVVISSGAAVKTYKVSLTPSLSLDKTMATMTNGQSPGFLSSVSSNGTNDGTAVIWAVAKAQFSGSTETNPPQLYAFDAMNGTTLYSGTAGDWSQHDANMNAVPVVANGHVYVASNKRLYVFGLN